VKPGELAKHEFDAQSGGGDSLVVKLPSATIVAKLSGGGTVAGDIAPPILTTEDPGLAPDAMPVRFDAGAITFSRPGAVIMSTSLALRALIAAKR